MAVVTPIKASIILGSVFTSQRLSSGSQDINIGKQWSHDQSSTTTGNEFMVEVREMRITKSETQKGLRFLSETSNHNRERCLPQPEE